MGGARMANGLLTLGFGMLCLQGNGVTSLQAIATNMFVPLFLLLITSVLWIVGNRGHGVAAWKYLGKRHSVIHVFWLIILVSSSNVAYLSLTLLRCVPLPGSPKGSVLFMDGTVQCFSGDHIPYFVLAIIVLLVVVIPPPVLLIWRPLHRFPKLVGFVDEASSMYKDNRRWWAAVNMLRRLVLALLHAVVTSGLARRTLFAMTSCLFVAVQGVFR